MDNIAGLRMLNIELEKDEKREKLIKLSLLLLVVTFIVFVYSSVILFNPANGYVTITKQGQPVNTLTDLITCQGVE